MFVEPVFERSGAVYDGDRDLVAQPDFEMPLFLFRTELAARSLEFQQESRECRVQRHVIRIAALAFGMGTTVLCVEEARIQAPGPVMAQVEKRDALSDDVLLAELDLGRREAEARHYYSLFTDS